MIGTKFTDENVQAGWKKTAYILQENESKNSFVRYDDDGIIDQCFTDDALLAMVFNTKKAAQKWSKEHFEIDLIPRKVEIKVLLFNVENKGK